MEKNKNRKESIRRVLAYLLAVCICIGGIPIASALGDEQSVENKTLLTYSDSGTEVDVFEPSEDFNDTWSLGVDKAAEQLASEGYENLEAANEKDVMIYVTKEDTENIAGFVKTSADETQNVKVPYMEKYNGSGGSYYLWRLCIAVKAEPDMKTEDLETEQQSTEQLQETQENIKKESIEYFWVRTDHVIELESTTEENVNTEDSEIVETEITERLETASTESNEITETESVQISETQESELNVDIDNVEGDSTNKQLKESIAINEINVKATSVGNFNELKNTIEKATSDIEVSFSGSYDVTSTITIPEGRKITVTGGGTLHRRTTFVNNIFRVKGKDTELVLNNIILEGNDIGAAEAGVLVDYDGTLVMNDPAVIRRFSRGGDADGSAVRLDQGGRFFMRGGTIEECRSGWGSAVNGRYYCYFEMTGGLIWHNISDNESAVDMWDGLGGNFVITGGEIKDNYLQAGGWSSGIVHSRDATYYKGEKYAGTFSLDELHAMLEEGTLDGGKLLMNYSYVGGSARIYDNFAGTNIGYMDVTKTWKDHAAVAEKNKLKDVSLCYFGGGYEGKIVFGPVNSDGLLRAIESYPNTGHTGGTINTVGHGQDFSKYNFGRTVDKNGKRDLRGKNAEIMENANLITPGINIDINAANGDYATWIAAADGFLYWLPDVPGEFWNTTTVKLVDQNGKEIPYTGGAAITTTFTATADPLLSNRAYAVNENTIAYENGIWEANTVNVKKFYAPDLNAKGYRFSGKYSLDGGDQTRGNTVTVNDFKKAHELVFYYADEEGEDSGAIKIEPGINGSNISDKASYYDTWQQAGTALNLVKAPDTVFRVTFFADAAIDIGNATFGLNTITKSNCAGLIFTGDFNETETQKTSEDGGVFSLSSDGYGNNTNLIDDNADPSKNKYKQKAPENVPTLTISGVVYKMQTPFTIRNIKLNMQKEIYGNGNRMQIGPGLERTENTGYWIYGGTYSDQAEYDKTSITLYSGNWGYVGTTAWNQKTINRQVMRIYGGTYGTIHGPAESGNTCSELDINIDIREGYGDFSCGLLEPLRNSNATADKVNISIHSDPGVIGTINNIYSYTAATNAVPKGYRTIIDTPDFTLGNISAGNAYVTNGTYTMPCELTINNVKKIGNICGVGIGGNSADSVVGRKSTTNFYPYKEGDDNYGIIIRINCDLETPAIIIYTKLIIGNGAVVNKTVDNYMNPNNYNDSVNVNGVLTTTDLSGDIDIIEGATLNIMGYQQSYGARNIGSSDNTGTLRVNPLAYSGVYVKGDYLGGLTLDVIDNAVSGLKKGQQITRFMTSTYADVTRLKEKGFKVGPNIRKNFGVETKKYGTDGYLILGDKIDYDVIYNANGATGGIPLTKSYEDGEAITVSGADNMIPPANKTFDYWESSIEIKVNGTNTSKLNPKDTFVMPPQNITLKAIWKEAKTDITFEGFEDGKDTLLKIKNEAGKVYSKALPKIKINGVYATIKDLEKMTYTYERYTRTGSIGNYTYGWSGKILQEGVNDADIQKLPISITKPVADNPVITANTKKSQSGIVKLTIKYNGDENSQASCIIISPGDVDLNGTIRIADIEMQEGYIGGDPNFKLDQYVYQKMMADMNSEAITGTIRVTIQDLELLEAIIAN